MNLIKIRQEIEKQGLKHKALARRIDVHPNTLSRFLTGKTVLGTEALLKLLKALNLSTEALMKKASWLKTTEASVDAESSIVLKR